jgi:hypothetical protein
MKHLAYGKEDAETFDRGRADEAKVLHDQAVFVALDAQKRRKHKPALMQYGGL